MKYRDKECLEQGFLIKRNGKISVNAKKHRLLS